MVLTPHLLVGAALGSRIKNYWAVFVLAILSHLILDAIPHWEYTSRLAGVSTYEFWLVVAKSFLDLLVGAAIVFWLARSSPAWRQMALGALAALLPDGLLFLYFFFQRFFSLDVAMLRWFYIITMRAHFLETNNRFFIDIIAEGATALAALLVLVPDKLKSRQKSTPLSR